MHYTSIDANADGRVRMDYCKKCSRIIKKDAEVCPYCGDTVSKIQSAFDDRLGERMDELNEIINERNRLAEMPGNNTDGGVIVEDGPAAQKINGDDGGIPGGKSVLLTLLSVFFAPVGIIIGAVYMSRDAISYRALGKRMLIVSLVSIVMSIVCCCAGYMFFINNYLANVY